MKILFTIVEPGRYCLKSTRSLNQGQSPWVEVRNLKMGNDTSDGVPDWGWNDLCVDPKWLIVKVGLWTGKGCSDWPDRCC